MVDFLKLAKGQNPNKGIEPLVTNSNVVGGSDLFKNFDQKMSEINLGGFDGNLRPANALENQSKVTAQPEYYAAALEKQDIQKTTHEIKNSMDYMHQNEQYIQYKQRIKDLLRENECENIGELLAKHGDSRKVLGAMSTLQHAFEADPAMKQHYQKTLSNYKQSTAVLIQCVNISIVVNWVVKVQYTTLPPMSTMAMWNKQQKPIKAIWLN